MMAHTNNSFPEHKVKHVHDDRIELLQLIYVRSVLYAINS